MLFRSVGYLGDLYGLWRQCHSQAYVFKHCKGCTRASGIFDRLSKSACIIKRREHALLAGGVHVRNLFGYTLRVNHGTRCIHASHLRSNKQFSSKRRLQQAKPTQLSKSVFFKIMSASAAKVSRKENSNHDGADETSGKEWRPPCSTPFSLVNLSLSMD